MGEIASKRERDLRTVRSKTNRAVRRNEQTKTDGDSEGGRKRETERGSPHGRRE